MVKNKVFIIAEAGVNHNGSVLLAKKLIDVAVDAGADAVKFQTFKAKSIVSKNAPKAEYQKTTAIKNETQFEMIKKLELDIDAHRELIKYCNQRGIIFLSSPFGLDSVVFLNKLGLKIFKIPSGEITNMPYLRKIGSLNKRVILSTGMANLDEIGEALDILVSSGTNKQNIIVLHCSTEYYTPMKNANLKAMLTIKDAFKVRVGYSDHTLGIEASIAAVALGASVIEKHFTLNRNMQGPDHKASLEPDELKVLVRSIRNIEMALGNGIKRPTKQEEKNKELIRKSIVAKINIPKGTKITQNMFDIKRPGTGIVPKFIDKLVGRYAKVEIRKDEPITWKEVKP